jgi:hypothetical protein
MPLYKSPIQIFAGINICRYSFQSTKTPSIKTMQKSKHIRYETDSSHVACWTSPLHSHCTQYTKQHMYIRTYSTQTSTYSSLSPHLMYSTQTNTYSALCSYPMYSTQTGMYLLLVVRILVYMYMFPLQRCGSVGFGWSRSNRFLLICSFGWIISLELLQGVAMWLLCGCYVVAKWLLCTSTFLQWCQCYGREAWEFWAAVSPGDPCPGGLSYYSCVKIRRPTCR